ncbi:hypothetical protein CRM22_007544 [Opisthorchis felineus]|uniref:F5/8 type C domain-containing protein n=1 Tax=Opisthorchis felineus TaxID=147828 RepID=A0A4S2LF91_OPIFE|nr:hypothetical protein CRM22_007544 [Opisthorchis felineus]
MIKKLLYWINVWVAILMSGFAQSFKPEQIVRRGPGSDLHCMSPLISAYDEFPDSAFSASSVLQNKTDFQPYQARLTDVYGSKEHTSGYAWCPNSMVDEMLREWIQAEFSDLVIIKSIFTAGRGDGNVKEFMPSFVLKYQREDGGTWYEHVKRDGARILKANSDPRNLARATLDSVVIAKRVRIYPYSRKGSRDVCLRFALYGCKFPDGVVSYTIPQGGLRTQTSFRSPALGDPLEPVVARHLKDLSYDGQIIPTTYQLTDGLGQLMDNVAFLGNLTRESDLYPSQPGFHFVGWPQGEQSEIQLIFKFDTTRRFTWIRLFTFDSLILRVRLFSHAMVAFSMNGSTFSDNVEFSTGRVQYYDPQLTSLSRVRREPIVRRSKQRKLSSSPQQDPRIYADPEYGGAIVVELALGERMGRYVRLTLTAADIWTVLSEVQFNSTVTKPPPVTDTPIVPVVEKTVDVDLTPRIAHSATGKGEPETRQDVQSSPFKSDKIPLGSTPNDANRKQGAHDVHLSGGKPNVNDAEGKLVTLLPIVIALGVLLFLLPVVVLIWLCSRRHFKRKQFKCRQKIHLTDGSTRTILRSVANSSMHEGAKLLGNSQSEGKSTLAPQLCFPNGIHPSNMFQRQNDPSLNGSAATNSVLHSISGNPGVVLSGPASVAPDKFESNADATQLCSPADGGYMTGVGSPLPNQTNIHPPLIPTLIAIPTTTPTGQIVLRPIGYGHSTTELSALASLGGEFITGGSLGGLGTPDSGSLYASIRASAMQLGQSTLSGGDSEAYDKTGSAFLPPPLPMRHLGRDEGVQWRGEDTDEDETDLRENGTAASRAKEPENLQQSTVSQCFDAGGNNIHTEGTEQENDNSESVGNSNAKTTTNPADTKLTSSIPSVVSSSPKPQEGTTFANEALFFQMKRTKLRPVSQRFSSALVTGHRHSGLSLPDGEEAYTPYLSASVRRPGSKGHVPVKALHGTPAGLVLRPYGPEYASASIFEFPVQISEACSVAPTSSMETVPANNYHPSFPAFPPASIAHAVPALTSDGTFNIYSGPASLPIGTGTLRPLSKHATPNSNHRLQTTVSQHPAGLMFLGGIGFEDMDALYQAVQPNVFSYPPEMGRPCNIYQPDQLVPAQQSKNGNLNLSETHEPWLLANSKQLNPLCSEIGPQKSAWLTDVRGGTLRLFPTPVQQFPLGHASTCVNDLSQITPQVSPQHYYPPQLILQHPNQHQQQQQQFRSMAVQPSNGVKLPNGEPHAQADVHRGSPVGAASASVAYLPGVSDSNSRETNHSGRLSIYSVCT